MKPGTAPLRVLLVDDDEQDLASIREMMWRLGLEVATASSIEDARSVFRKEQSEIVFCNMEVRGRDGLALARALQEEVSPSWLPFVALSASNSPEVRLRALEAGADDFLVKPLSSRLLLARIRQANRVLLVQRRSNARARELQRQFNRRSEDEEVARLLMQRLINSEKLSDPALRHWIASADTFSGDLVAAARTPGNMLHVLLADGTGHGLSASLNVLPVISPFYRMTEKGFPLEPLVREINRHVRQILPGNRFIATTLAAVDVRAGLMYIWNGGNPPPILIGHDGRPRLYGGTRHLALGILDDGDFDCRPDVLPLTDVREVLVYSDGLIEAENAEGEAFGMDRALEVLHQCGGVSPLEHLLDAVHDHLAGRPARDDVSAAVIDCRPEAHPETSLPPCQPPSGQFKGEGQWRMALRLGAQDLKKLQLVPTLVGMIEQFRLAPSQVASVYVVLSEIFSNALEHGLLGLDSAVKSGPEGATRYLELQRSRLAVLADGWIELEVEHFGSSEGEGLRIRCRDSGPGFDHGALGGAVPAGVGIRRLRERCSRVEFRGCGNEIEVELDLLRPA